MQTQNGTNSEIDYNKSIDKIHSTVFKDFTFKGEAPKYHVMILDFETTGIDVTKAGIVQVGVYSTVFKQYYSQLVNPNGIKTVSWSSEAIKVHGITLSKVEKKPNVICLMNELMKFATLDYQSIPIFLAHNASFDSRFFEYFYKGCLPENERRKYYFVDTLSWFKDVEKPNEMDLKEKKSKKLEILGKFLLPDEKLSFHDAGEDVKCLKLLLDKYVDKWDDKSINFVELSESKVIYEPLKDNKRQAPSDFTSNKKKTVGFGLYTTCMCGSVILKTNTDHLGSQKHREFEELLLTVMDDEEFNPTPKNKTLEGK
jgi:DNA polymerase III epsilon subunit-like protein